jgi:hypothetical protein
MTIGITIKQPIGVGDALQFSSVFENYYRTHNKKLIAMEQHWFLDHNPYVNREFEERKPEKIIQMWNFPAQWEWPVIKRQPVERQIVYLSNAEIWAAVVDSKVFLNRPRLYQYEDFPFEDRKTILLHTNGKSHGDMPPYIIEHVIKKYGKTGQLYRIGNPPPDTYTHQIPQINTPSLWELARVISQARMVIGMDSGPSWVAACYPDVLVKKLRTKPNPPSEFHDWVPLERRNIHSFWDDRCHMIFNASEQDIGFTYSYRKI